MPDRTLRYMPLDELLPNPANPKTHDLDELRASIGRLGFIEPAVVDERTGQLVSGHGRHELLSAAEQLGEDPPEGVKLRNKRWMVPVVRGWASANDDEAAAALVALNKVGEGLWDDSALGTLLSSLREDAGLDGVGFDEKSLDTLLAGLSEHELPSGNGGSEDVPANFMVVVECSGEQQQTELLQRLSDEGLNVRAVLS